MLYHLSIIALLLAQPAPTVQITTLDEQTFEGGIAAWTNTEVQLEAKGASEDRSYPLDQVLRVDLIGNPAPTPRGPLCVVLLDGSQLFAAGFRTEGERAVIAGAVADDAAKELAPPVQAVRSVRLQEIPSHMASLETQWQEILALQPAGDLIVIRKPEANSLNFVEGTLGEIGPESIAFTLDGETLEVGRERVFGVVYFRRPDSNEEPPATTLVTSHKMRLMAEQVSMRGDLLVATNRHLGTVEIPLHRVASVDYSRDRLIYLSDIEPTRSEWSPPPGGMATESLFSSVARDRGFYSPQLMLEYPAESLATEETTSAGLSQRTSLRKGLAIRSRTEITYRVPKGFQWFRATAGIDPQTKATGKVELILLGDGQELLRQVLSGDQAPCELELDVASVGELTLIVDFGPDTTTDVGAGDNLHLGAARFTK